MTELFNEYLLNLDVPILNIESKVGLTGYIDFLQIQDLNENSIMKGIDCYDRRFIVFIAHLNFNDSDIIHTSFTTIFQRYQNNKRLWHSAGTFYNNEKLLIDTVGGMNIDQAQFIMNLLTEKEIDIDYDTACKLKIKIPSTTLPSTTIKIFIK